MANNKRRKTHVEEDQYGSRGSTDRDGFQGGGSGRGGGSGGRGGAGGRGARSVKGANMEYVAPAVPKFLQAHAHLLRGAGGGGGGRGDEGEDGLIEIDRERLAKEEKLAAAAEDDDALDDHAFGLRTALEQNPELAASHPELQKVADATAAEGIKARANVHFGKKEYAEAVALYGEAIRLDPGNHVYHSNESAALIELGEFEKAVESARRAVKCDGGKRYGKGFYRLGLALLKMGKGKDAVYNLKRAKELEPDLKGVDEVLFRAVGKAELESKEEGRKSKDGGKGKRGAAMLSFGDEEEDEEDDEEDDEAS